MDTGKHLRRYEKQVIEAKRSTVWYSVRQCSSIGFNFWYGLLRLACPIMKLFSLRCLRSCVFTFANGMLTAVSKNPDAWCCVRWACASSLVLSRFKSTVFQPDPCFKTDLWDSIMSIISFARFFVYLIEFHKHRVVEHGCAEDAGFRFCCRLYQHHRSLRCRCEICMKNVSYVHWC